MKQLFDFFFKGNFLLKLLILLWSLLTSFFSSAQINEIPLYKAKNIKLHKEIVKMDSLFFNAYNTCDIKT